MRRRTFLLAGAAAAAVAGLGTVRSYRRDMAEAEARIGAGSALADTRFGPIEWAAAGEGPPLLMLHGTGGGFDQGLAFTRRLRASGWRVIAPSRFGYLRSAFPDDPSSANEADAMADLLDRLGIDRLPVIGGSAGAMPAIAFAIRHADRCSALVAIVPAAFAPGRPAVRPDPVGAAIIGYGLRSDLLFWTGIRLAEDAMIGALLATDPALVHAAAPDEQARVRAILQDILPVSRRARGLLNDGRLAADPAPQDLGRIGAPTLAISLPDDRFQTLAAARHIAASVPGARLLTYPAGGHVWVGHDAALMGEVDGFLRAATGRE